jgi:hypothetical protein
MQKQKTRLGWQLGFSDSRLTPLVQQTDWYPTACRVLRLRCAICSIPPNGCVNTLRTPNRRFQQIRGIERIILVAGIVVWTLFRVLTIVITARKTNNRSHTCRFYEPASVEFLFGYSPLFEY